MPFKKILLPLDGSLPSQVAVDGALWLASKLDASVYGQHVLDPRLVDLFVSPEFAEALGFRTSIDTSEKVFSALRKIGRVILELFTNQALAHSVEVKTFIDTGYVAEEILKRAANYDLIVVGHHSRGDVSPTEITIGSIAERIAIYAKKPVLVASRSLGDMDEIIVAYDGSEPACGALLMAENLAKATKQKFKVITVIDSEEHRANAKLIIEQAKQFLREKWTEEIFQVLIGSPADALLAYSNKLRAIIVLGAYGFHLSEENVLGSTTSSTIRRSDNPILIFR